MMAGLHADRDQLATFIDALFRYADEGTYASLRAFDQADRAVPTKLIRPIKINGDLSRLIDEATSAAEAMANEARPIVFAPPICTFGNPDRARVADLANGLTLSVEIDDGDTTAARKRLEGMLGPCTVIVESGGEWSDPLTGEVFPKLHLHWRLSEPTRADEDHARLRQARDLAARLVGADPTGKPVVHPLRWPGSWNRKAEPRMARIVAFNDAAEIDLAEALERVEEAIEAAGIEQTGQTRSGTPQAPVGLVREAMAVIPNAGTEVHYDTWIRLGYAAYRATAGSAEGYAIWDEWSQKSEKYDGTETEAGWKRISRAIEGGSAPRTIGAGTIFYFAGQAGWVRPTQDEEPPPDITDPGYIASLEAMSAEEWGDLEQREGGAAIPATEEAKKKAGPDVLWILTEPWDEAAIPARPWVARGYLLRKAVTVVSGPGSAGKSSLMVGWASCLTLGSALNKMRPTGPMKVVTYNVEDDEDEQKRRFSAMFRHLGLPLAAHEGRLAILGPRRVGTLLHQAREGRLLVNTPVMDKLEAFISEFRPDVAILDPFVELHTEEENDNTAVRAVMARFRSMAIEHNMAVVILHHARKGQSEPGDPDSLRGASSIVSASRITLTVNVMTDDEAKAIKIPPDKRRNYFRLDGAKNNYAPIEEAEWFQRKEGELLNGDGVAVAWPWKPPSIWAETIPSDIHAVLDQIEAGPSPGVMYAATRQGGASRWVGNVLCSMLGVNDVQAKKMVGQWLESGLLLTGEFFHPEWRRNVPGVQVDNSKRPTV